jgi:hypothetical protein
MIRILFALIGYVCTATVITALLALGYLWQQGQLEDEKIFRTVALWHGVDMVELAERRREEQLAGGATPREELSLAEQQRAQQVTDRNFEVKMLALERGRREFDHLRRKLEEKTIRIDRQVQEWQAKLDERYQLATNESIENVVNNLQMAPPEIAKADLLRMMDEGRAEDVIKLWITMAPNTRKRILETIEGPEELDQLHEMHKLMLAGYPNKPEIEAAIRELEDVDNE